MAVALILERPHLGHLLTEGTWMSKEKEVEQEGLSWLHTEQLWEVKQSSHNGRESESSLPYLLQVQFGPGCLTSTSVS